MKKSFFDKIHKAHNVPKALPGEKEIDQFIVRLLQFLFPELNNIRFKTESEIQEEFAAIQQLFEDLLLKTEACEKSFALSSCQLFFSELENIYDLCIEDADAILSGDPAAIDRKEVIRTYPGFFAIAIYRIAHVMLGLDIPYLPRIFTEYAHVRTSIDIHPKAKIGRKFCIDHGTGVVVGETCIIGSNVKVYQGVTLGAMSVRKEMALTKRHPTIGDNVVIYAGATILGGRTVIGANSIIGGNVWLTESVAPNSRVYYAHDSQLIKASV
ncbi:serine O-acetyltransferase [Reichenbachiella agarivorans]|uniref:Serine O-acetyltransferase n=1 Tax=Reichenbachiella agarivorans TaxID=2979464 RepID=A0ABY6CM56_9BACT|nr:serine O-acetyltransferase [Reichenbachiella agarivorans]UXP31165.1 serine O-acetyltransferase [Reichenbachiella agarivorans]